jgi:AraC-like DNA-binding protein
MVSTIQIKPASILQPFVSCYALREFNTGEWEMPQPLHAVQECYMSFFLKKNKFCNLWNVSGTFKTRQTNSLITLLTQSQGCISWKGNYVLFCVQFKANGFSAIFGISQKILINTVLHLSDILGNDNNLLTDQLESSKDIFEMGTYMNSYLTGKMLRQKLKNHTIIISAVSDIIMRNKGVVSMDSLAKYANMSFRNFERRFIEETGMPPKLYARITRFYNALENKMLHPNKRWVDIANENGYFDQAHFIKDVLEFSSKTPQELFNDTPPPTEKFLVKVET